MNVLSLRNFLKPIVISVGWLFHKGFGGFARKGCIRVLLFHDVQMVDVDKFFSLVDRLKEAHEFLELNQFFSQTFRETFIRSGKVGYLITFDDAFANVLYNVASGLKQRGVEFLMFVPTSFPPLRSEPARCEEFIRLNLGVEKSRRFEDLLPMDFEELRSIMLLGCELGSHTRSHQKLADLSHVECEYQLSMSKQDIEKIQNQCRCIAYPFGALEDINPASVRLMLDYYEFVFSGIRGGNSALRQKVFFRDSISLKDHLFICIALAEGALDFCSWRRRRILMNWIWGD